jgi:NTP pyrophosphatase (non-canonical NTP hydrolase)
LHGAIGIETEIGEIFEAVAGFTFDPINFLEEMGDLLWYNSIFSRLFGLDFDAITPTEITDFNLKDIVISMKIEASKILDIYKKRCFYGKPIDANQIVTSVTILHNLVNACIVSQGSTIEQVRQKNIDKLKSRFGDKFEAAKAINRDTNAEREILEK